MPITSSASISSLIRMAPSLRGRACADGRGQRHARRRRCDEPDVEERAEETGEGFDPDVGQGVVALHGDQRAGGQREETDDDDRAADDGQRAGAHPHARDLPQHLARVAPDRRRRWTPAPGRRTPSAPPACGCVDDLLDRMADACGLVQLRSRRHLHAERGGQDVDEEQCHEGEHDGFVDRVADRRRPAADVQSLVAGDQARPTGRTAAP